MKIGLSLIGLTGLVIACTVTTIPKAMTAPTNKYFCAVYQGVPRTFVNTPRGNVMMISWVNPLGSKTPRERCIEVSNRFQRFYDNRTLKDVATGIVNNQPVLCAVSDKNSSCNQTNVLVTLPPGVDRYQTAQQLLNIRGLSNGATINLSNDEKIETYVNGENYYDLNLIENAAPIVEESLTAIGQ